MSIAQSITLTKIILGLVGPIILLYWLFAGRQIIRNTSAGRLYPKSMGLRIGGSGVTERSVRNMATRNVIFVLLLCVMVAIFGYFWWFGIAVFFGVSVFFMYLDMSRIVLTRFCRPILVFAVAFLPFSIAYGLAWAHYCNWLGFPLGLFCLLNLITLVGLLYVAITPMPDGGDQNQHTHAKGGRSHGKHD